MRGDANAVARGAHAALKDEINRKLAREIHATCRCLSSSAGDDQQFLDPRQGSDDVLGETIGEKSMLAVTREIGERKDGNRWPFGQGQGRLGLGRSLATLGLYRAGERLSLGIGLDAELLHELALATLI